MDCIDSKIIIFFLYKTHNRYRTDLIKFQKKRNSKKNWFRNESGFVLSDIEIGNWLILVLGMTFNIWY